jgi:hypothetical protein
MAKYSFHDLKSKDNHAKLPEDINVQIDGLAGTIGDAEGITALRMYRENRWFGQVVLWDKSGRHIATAYFDHGICFRHEITSYRKSVTDISIPVAILSVKNEMLDEKKKGG